ncbi:MAG: Zn-dependent hydrolase, partial [Paracoccus sp.]|nr:Zn-dependent hydrolase [Paracoccus sp. (in: a-proteobacteria)]
MTLTGTAVADNMKIDGDRLWESLMEMAKIGPGVAGGNNRQTLTDADAEGRALFRMWCEEAGMNMALDRMGNMFMRHEGEEPDLDPVYIGSHLDTQPTGGKYDGVLGVLSGLEVIRSIRDMGIRTRRPIVVVNWTNEEGTRFAPAMLASGVFAGIHDEDYANSREDAEGRTFGAELDRIGWRGDEEPGRRPIHAMFEYHIEQGPILEAEGKQVGIVTHGQGLWWLQVTLLGKDAHTGSTPMEMRMNAGLGMARITEAVHRIAMEHQPDAVGAVGQANVYPNSRNVIPGRAVFTIDFRSPDLDKLTSMRTKLEAEATEIAKDLGLGIEI